MLQSTNYRSGSGGTQCCGAGAGGAVIKLPPGDGAVKTNYRKNEMKELKKFYRKRHGWGWRRMRRKIILIF
jgi:hypothetical protein